MKFGDFLKTALNPNLKTSSATVINTAAKENTTELNMQSAAARVNLDDDVVICGKYRVIEELDVASGEATLLRCEYSGKEYVAKVYTRQFAIKDDVVEKLKGIHSPYIASLIETGSFNGYPVEILPYYKNGSLAGKKISLQHLKDTVIPALNEGLHVLHENDIIHKDLKPSNIMLCDSKKSVAIIDFGISSAHDAGSTVLVTQTGMTPDYSAPETFRGLYLDESDYYALGITLYELYTGRTPYAGLQGEELERMLTVQRIPMPEDMPTELQELITALTYQDITNRKDKSNPNRRWTYEEVRNWCNGTWQPIPGTNAGTVVNPNAYPFPYKMNGTSYAIPEALAEGLNANWDIGKKDFFRGYISRHISNFDAETANKLEDISESADTDQDIGFFKGLYVIDSKHTSLLWKGKVYNGLPDFGDSCLSILRSGNSKELAIIEEMLQKGVLSTYFECTSPKQDKQITFLKSLESDYRTYVTKPRDKTLCLYRMAFSLSEKKEFLIDGHVFSTPEDLTAYMNQLVDSSYEVYNAFAEKLLPEGKTLNVEFEAWLLALGKKDAIDEWRKEF